MKYGIAVVVALVAEYLIGIYWANIPFYWPAFLVHLLILFFAMFCVVGIADAIQNNSSGYEDKNGFRGILILGAASVITLVLILVANVGQSFQTLSLHELGNVKIVENPIEVADTNHIRVIPMESAEQIGNQVLGSGNLGALYELNHYEIQRVRGTLYWVAPLEFRGWFAWRRAEFISPGYVMVNAEDPKAEPKLVTGYKMRYTWGAWFGSNFSRLVYFRNMSFGQYEPTFEVDESGKPWYVISMVRPSVGFTGEKLEKVVILDPETGETQDYKIGKTPEWADRIFPEALAEDYTDWWGSYIHGFWNAHFGNKDVQVLTTTEVGSGEHIERNRDVFLVYNSQTGHPVWISGITSPGKDLSMTGYMTTDSITGEMTFYRDPGYGNEQAAINAVESASEVSIQKNYHAAQAIFYNIYGTRVWIVPVLSNVHIIEKVAIVYAKDTRHVAVGDSKEDALERYKDLLTELKAGGGVPTQSSSLTTWQGKVTRIQAVALDGKAHFYLMIDTVPNKILLITPAVSSEVLVTEKGDKVNVTCYDTLEDEVPVKTFDNLAIDLAKSVPQQKYEVAKVQEKQRTREEILQQKQELQKKMDDLKQQELDSQ